MDKNIFIKELLEWIKTISLAFVAALVINIFIFEMTAVNGVSMYPTLNNNDRLFAVKINQLFEKVPDHGDIVIVDGNTKRIRTFKDEVKDSAIVSTITRNENRDMLIKRVIGKPGDVLEFRDGEMYRNGKLLEENYIKEKMKMEDFKVVVPDDHVFVMGDNRNDSKDSRVVGPIPMKNVRAKVLFRVFPFSRMNKF